jgi:hypothetical protein
MRSLQRRGDMVDVQYPNLPRGGVAKENSSRSIWVRICMKKEPSRARKRQRRRRSNVPGEAVMTEWMAHGPHMLAAYLPTCCPT